VLRVYAVAQGEPCARSVRRPTEPYAHIVTRTLEARIIEEEVTTCRRPGCMPAVTICSNFEATTFNGQSLHVMTCL